MSKRAECKHNGTYLALVALHWQWTGDKKQ